jgi:flagellar hook protein FlgE
MAFQTGLSGLNASSKNLDVIGNNIANANTTGMKSSRTEFADLVASSIGVGGGNNAGLGVAVDTVSQQFTQGNLSITGNALDVAINGSGFFQLRNTDGTIGYTRAGNFKMDNTGAIVTNSGAKVMGFPTALNGTPTSTTATALTLPTGAPIPAHATSSVTAEFNLDASVSDVYDPATNMPPFTTYGTSISVYDSQGSAIPFSMTFTRAPSTAGDPPMDNWEVRNSQGTPLLDSGGSPITLSFDAAGKLVAPKTMPTITIQTGSETTPEINTTVNFAGVTQFASPFGVTKLSQDGYTSGSFTGLSITEGGVINARYSNGQTQAAGMLTLADFRNVQGLAPTGAGVWVETFASGQPLMGQPGQGKFGATRSGALEDSNVDLTAELVNMMTAQRAYQANAQTIKTQDQVMQTLVNLR